MNETGKLQVLIEKLGLQSKYDEILNLEYTSFNESGELISLDLGLMRINELPEPVFDDFPSLQMLNLSGNPINTLPKGIFHKLPKLTAIGLNDTSLTFLSDDLFPNHERLEYLSINGCNIQIKPIWLDDLLSRGVHVSFQENPFSS